MNWHAILAQLGCLACAFAELSAGHADRAEMFVATLFIILGLARHPENRA